MGFDTDALRWFQQVADGVTVTEVAELYGVSQPAVSRGLARLEDQVGAPLLRREGRVLRPTYAGTVLKRHVDTVLHGLDDGLAALDELLDPETGTVTVAFQLSLGTWFVPQVVRAFRDLHPRVAFRLSQSHDAWGSSLLAEGRIDLELTSRVPREPGIGWQLLHSQPLRLAVPPGHRLAGRTAVSLAEAADEDFVMLRPTWQLRGRIDRLCADAGFTPRVAFEGDDLPVLRAFVAAGLGVAVVPAWEPELHLTGGEVLVPLTDHGAVREVHLAWSDERRLLPSAELFRRFVLEYTPEGVGH